MIDYWDTSHDAGLIAGRFERLVKVVEKWLSLHEFKPRNNLLTNYIENIKKG